MSIQSLRMRIRDVAASDNDVLGLLRRHQVLPTTVQYLSKKGVECGKTMRQRTKFKTGVKKSYWQCPKNYEESHIHADEHKSYKSLNEWGFVNKAVNHSKN